MRYDAWWTSPPFTLTPALSLKGRGGEGSVELILFLMSRWPLVIGRR